MFSRLVKEAPPFYERFKIFQIFRNSLSARKARKPIQDFGRFKRTNFDKFFLEKFELLGLKNRLFLLLSVLNLGGFALYLWWPTKEHYYEHFAYKKEGRNNIFTIFNSMFASTKAENVLVTAPILLILGRYFERSFGTVFLAKLTFMAIIFSWWTLMPSTKLEKYLGKSPLESILKKEKPIFDCVENNNNFRMGAHGIAATYLTYFLLRKGLMPVAFALALADLFITGTAYSGGYMAGLMAFLIY
jgi:hypothetical protein